MDILVGCPCANTINVTTASCIQNLWLPTMYIQGSLVYDARNDLVKEAIERNAKYLLFIDSDMSFEAEGLQKLLDLNADIATGLYVERSGSHHRPTVYKHIDIRTKEHEAVKEYFDLIDRDVFEVEGCGMGFCLIKTDVLKTIITTYGDCFQPICGLGEDLSFCWKAKQCGFKIMCDSTFTLGHIGEYIYTLKDWN